MRTMNELVRTLDWRAIRRGSVGLFLAVWLGSCGVEPAIDGGSNPTGPSSASPSGISNGNAAPASPVNPGETQTTPGQLAQCGNRTVDSGELCDSNVKPCKELDPSRFDTGDARCNAGCSDWDLSGCKKTDLPLSIDLGAAPTNYLSLPDMEALLQKWVKAGAGLLEFKVFGTSNGKNNFYLRVSKAVSTGQTDLPKVLVDGGTHGDEWIGPAIVIGFMHKYISQYGKEAKITELINTRDVYFVPVVSPTGYTNKVREEEGQDPNRCFPLHGATPTTNIANLINLFRTVQFNATIDYHASGRLMMTPWAYTQTQFDEGGLGAKLRTLAQSMAQTSNYRWGSVIDMVGYTSDNSSIDWFYTEGKKIGAKTCAMGVEAGTSKIPAASEIKTETDLNVQALTTFIEKAPVLFSTYDVVDDVVPPVYPDLSPYFVPGLE